MTVRQRGANARAVHRQPTVGATPAYAQGPSGARYGVVSVGYAKASLPSAWSGLQPRWRERPCELSRANRPPQPLPCSRRRRGRRCPPIPLRRPMRSLLAAFARYGSPYRRWPKPRASLRCRPDQHDSVSLATDHPATCPGRVRPRATLPLWCCFSIKAASRGSAWPTSPVQFRR